MAENPTVPDGPDSGRVTYVDSVTDALNHMIPAIPVELLRYYVLLVLVKGTATSLEDVHDAWAMWRIDTRPDHPALVPFEELTPEVQGYDREYRDAIRRVAAERAS